VLRYEKGGEMKFKKILMLDFNPSNLEQTYWDRIDQLTQEKILIPRDSPEVPRHLATTDCLLVKLGAKVGKETIDSTPNLRYIGMFGTGYGGIDDSYAASKGIAVCNIAGYSTEAVAELAFGVILEHIRELERAKSQARKGDYSEATFQGYEIKGKVFGVIGLGRIGGRIAEIALNGFGADTRYWSRNRKKKYEDKGIRYVEVDTLIPDCDFLSVNLAYNKETEQFLDRARIQKIKPGAVVVNLAPMELINVDGLEERLKAGDITFILDHSDELPAAQAKRLSKYKNCIMYPPVGYTTAEATLTKQAMFVDNLENFLKGTPTNKVN